MNKKSRILFYIFSLLSLFLVVEILTLFDTKSMNSEMLANKKSFVQLSSLPDLAITTESYASRHRTLSTTFDIYPDDGSLREYSLSTYAFSYSHILNPHAKGKE